MKWHKRIWIMSFVISGLAVLAFFVLDSLGWREDLTILTGTIPLGGDTNTASVKAAVYLVFYFASVLLAPVLLLMTGISFLWVRRSAGALVSGAGKMKE